MRIYYWVFFCFLLFTKCDFNKEINFAITQSANCILSNDSSLIATPLEMKMMNHVLFISDFRGDSLLWIYDLSKQIMRKRDMPLGIGPTEYQPPIQILIMDSNVVNIYNRWHYNWNLLKFNNQQLKFTSIQDRKMVSTDIDMIYPIANYKYIASGRFKEGRYALLDSIGNILNYFGDYPSFLSGEESIDNFPRFMFHQSQFSYNKTTNEILSVTSHVLDIMKDTGSVPILKKRILLSPYQYKYQYGDDWASANSIRDTKRGVIRVSTTDKYIYLLYNPNIENGKEQKKVNEIWIFDWDGNPIKKIIPDYTILSFCVDKSNKTIYSIVEAPEPRIAKIELL